MASRYLVVLTTGRPGCAQEFVSWHRQIYAPWLADTLGRSALTTPAGAAGAAALVVIALADELQHMSAADLRQRLRDAGVPTDPSLDGQASYVALAVPEAHGVQAETADADETFAVLADSLDAIEEVFSRLYDNADAGAIMALPGAVFARKHSLRPILGEPASDCFIFCGFSGQDRAQTQLRLEESIGKAAQVIAAIE